MTRFGCCIVLSIRRFCEYRFCIYLLCFRPLTCSFGPARLELSTLLVEGFKKEPGGSRGRKGVLMKFRICSFLAVFLPMSLLVAGGCYLDSVHSAQREALRQEQAARFRAELLVVGGELERGGAINTGASQVVDSRPGWPDATAYALLSGNGSLAPVAGRAVVTAARVSELGDAFATLLARAEQERALVIGRVGDRLLGFYPLPAALRADSMLLAEADIPAAFLALDQSQFRGLVYPSSMLTIASLLLFLLAGFFASRRLRRIERALQRFSEGDAESRSGLQGWGPIARLGRRFDQMAEHMADERRHLAESEERLQFALRGSDIGIWDWHMASGRTYYSPRWKSLLGFADDELVAHAEEWLKRVHADDLAAVMDRLKDHLAGESEFFISEHRLRRKNGSYLWVLERGVAMRDAQGVASRMVGALSDISRRKEVEAALLRSKEEYRSVLEGVTQIIFRSDPRGRLLFLNPAWAELTGFPLDESLATNLADYLHADDRARVIAAFREAAAGDLPTLACELRLLCRDGGARWFSLHARGGRDAEGNAIVAGVLSDLDAQKATEDALTRSNGERNAILSLSPDGFVFIDRDGRVAYVNPAFLAMTQFVAADVVGQDIAQLEAGLGRLCDPARPLPTFSSLPEDRATALYLLQPGKLILHVMLRSIPNTLGGVHGHVMFFRDVTRETEVDRIKSEFLSTAAHELRTPMASIFGFSELLLAREFDAATQRDLIQTIHRQTQNLINLVNELLDLARIEARGGKTFKMLEQDLGPLLLNALAAQYVPPETHRLELDLPKSMPKVIVDGEKFQQCLTNVLSNAIKYSPAGGAIRVTGARRQAKGGEQFGIVVGDQGIGMTAEQVGHIFDRFYRVDTSGAIPGTGLGLSLVKEIMGIFNGEVTVVSAPGAGTEVVLWLPLPNTERALSGGALAA